MTTAELRNAARAAEEICNWIEAAKLWDAAADIHPGHRNPRGLGSMDAMDIANMRRKAEGCRMVAA